MFKDKSISEILEYWIGQLDPENGSEAVTPSYKVSVETTQPISKGFASTQNSVANEPDTPAPPTSLDIRVIDRNETQVKLAQQTLLNFKEASVYTSFHEDAFKKWYSSNNIPDCLTHGKPDSIRRDGLELWRHSNYEREWLKNKFSTITEIYPLLKTAVSEDVLHGLYSEKAIPQFVYLLADKGNHELYIKPLEYWLNLLHEVEGEGINRLANFNHYIVEGEISDLLNESEDYVESIIEGGLPQYFKRPASGSSYSVKQYSRDALVAFYKAEEIHIPDENIFINKDIYSVDIPNYEITRELHLLGLLPPHIYSGLEPKHLLNIHALQSWLNYLNSTNSNHKGKKTTLTETSSSIEFHSSIDKPGPIEKFNEQNVKPTLDQLGKSPQDKALDEKDKEITLLKLKLKEAHNVISQHISEKKRYTPKKPELNKELSDSEHLNAALEANKVMRSLKRQALDKLKKTEEELAILKASLSGSDKKIRVDNGNLRKILLEKEETITAQAKRLGQLRQENYAATPANDLANELTQANELIESYRKEGLSLDKKISDMSKVISALKKSKQDLIKKHAEKIKKLKSEEISDGNIAWKIQAAEEQIRSQKEWINILQKDNEKLAKEKRYAEEKSIPMASSDADKLIAHQQSRINWLEKEIIRLEEKIKANEETKGSIIKKLWGK